VRPVLAIVIVSYNARDFLTGCLESIFRHPPRFPFEVVVVDNVSSDGSPQRVRERFPDVTLLANADNRGFGPACNQGWRAVDSEHVLLLNSDTEVLPGTLDALVGALEARPRAGVVAPLAVDGRGDTIQMSWGWTPLFLGEILQRFFAPRAIQRSATRRRIAQWLQRRERMAPIVSGAAMLFRRAALEQVGGMDEDYVFYLEDSDICTRLWRAGWQVWFSPQAKIVHHLGKSSASQPGKTALLYRQSQLLFYRKHGGFLDRLLIHLYLRLKYWRIYFPPREAAAREFHRRLRGILESREKVTL